MSDSLERSDLSETGKIDLPEVAVIIVGFHNAADVIGCLRALSRTRRAPRFDVFIAENGGAEGFAGLRSALTERASPCRQARDGRQGIARSPGSAEMHFSLPHADGDAQVHIAQMPENLGYAGAVNAWLRPLLQRPGWRAAWILNPDTEPTPSALFELSDHSSRRDKGMVGSQIVCAAWPGYVQGWGLSWRKVTSRTVAVGSGAAGAIEPDPDSVEAQMDAPNGASLFVTRRLIERIGLMDERYFLYFEDLEWGCRAKKLEELGYAHRSIVPHQGGTTTGSASTRAGRSKLAVYMEFRNRILFVRHEHHAWLLWTVLMQILHAATYLASGAFANMLAAGQGSFAGLRGETGRPGRVLELHAAGVGRLPEAFQGG
jgi:GT2 family glycosyltransferase